MDMGIGCRRDSERSGGKQVSNWRRLYYVRIKMSDGQEFVKEFDDYTKSRGFREMP